MPDKVAMFVTYMDSVGHARATIRTYMSALSRKDKLADEEDRTKKVVNAAGTRASTPRVKHPIILEKLKKILWAANLVLAEFNASLMRAVFSLAFHVCAHIGEMVSPNDEPQHTILAQNMAIRASEVSVAFMFFKHQKGNAPETRILQGATPDVCPSAMLRHYAQPGDLGSL